MYKHAKIVMTSINQGKVILDGKEVEGLTDFNLDCGVDKIPTLKLTVMVETVDVELSEVAVKVRQVDVTTLNNNNSRNWAVVDDGLPRYQCGEFTDNDAMDNQES
ncbi:hypothetical protein MIM_c10750 [Advenella mimigardefordensis DPN7]|uniref:Uncharacterized protein n=2 Tax=Advenella mimigardefordensis TaxID=302406 RepID=W0PDQ9_ADVMD|nr:hypothetical protein MIM_c10750 [Advenella mimigardefordensis DPN7]